MVKRMGKQGSFREDGEGLRTGKDTEGPGRFSSLKGAGLGPFHLRPGGLRFSPAPPEPAPPSSPLCVCAHGAFPNLSLAP